RLKRRTAATRCALWATKAAMRAASVNYLTESSILQCWADQFEFRFIGIRTSLQGHCFGSPSIFSPVRISAVAAKLHVTSATSTACSTRQVMNAIHKANRITLAALKRGMIPVPHHADEPLPQGT